MAGKVTSCYLADDCLEILERNGYRSNLSGYINNLIRLNCQESAAMLAIRIKEKLAKVQQLREILTVEQVELEQLQAAYNIANSSAKTIESARDEALKLFKPRVKGMKADAARGKAVGIFDGPAHQHLIKECGFQTVIDMADWCVSQLSTKQATVDAPPVVADPNEGVAAARSRLLELYCNQHRTPMQLLDTLAEGWADEVREAGFDDAKAAVDWLMTQPRKLQPTVQTASKGGI